MRTSGTDTSTYHIKKRKAQIEEQCAVMAGQWMVSVTWLTRSDDRPLEFAASDAPHAHYIGIRDSAVRGVIGHFGADVTAAAGKYTISAEFHSRIRKRRP